MTNDLPQFITDRVSEFGYITVPELAQCLRVGEEKVLRWINNGELAALDVRNSGKTRPCYRIMENHIVEFFEAREVRKQPPPETRQSNVTRRRRPVKNYLD